MTTPELNELLENLHFIGNDPKSHAYLRLISGLSLEAITELYEENQKLKGELTETARPDVERLSLGLDNYTRSSCMVTDADGAYVSYEDYVWMSNYADRLVEFTNLPCLPADLQNLRAANLAFATEIETLQKQIDDFKKVLISLTV